MRQRIIKTFILSTVILTWSFLLGCGSNEKVVPPPTLNSLSVTTAVAGGAPFNLTLLGTNFNLTSKVSFGAVSLIPTSAESTRLTVVVPASAITEAAVLKVSVVGSTASNSLDFTINNPTPAVASLSHTSTIMGSASFAMDIHGINFVPTSTVSFGTLSLVPTYYSPTRLTVMVPDSALTASGPVSVKTVSPAPGGGISNAMTFMVNHPVPTLSALPLDNIVLDSPDFTLSLIGTGFVAGATVNFGSTALTPTAITATEISVVVPKALIATSGIVPVTAVNPLPGGGASNSLEFTVKNPVPTLTSLSLDTITAGEPDFALTLVGTQFVAGAKVNFGSATLTPSTLGSTQIEVTVPASAIIGGGITSITVTNPGPGGGASNAQTFTIMNPVPTLGALSPQIAVLRGQAFQLDLSGTKFVPQSVVQFGSTLLTPTSFSATHLTVMVPETAITISGPVSVKVISPTPGGGTSNTLEFTVNNPVPTLTSLPQDSTIVGGPDFTLNIVGTGFVDGAIVNFGTTPLTPATVTWTQLSVVVPRSSIASSVVIPVTVVNPTPGGGVSNVLEFTVKNPVPTLTSLSLTSIAAGEPDFALTLVGTEFVGGAKANFGSLTLNPSTLSGSQMEITVPASAIVGGGIISITVTNPGPGGGASNAQTFTVVNPLPTVSALSPQLAVLGDPAFPLQITGTGFVPQTTVLFGSHLLTPTSVSPTLLTVTVPETAFATSGTVSVTVESPTPGGGTSNALDFAVNNPVPALAVVSPPSVTAGGSDVLLTIQGSRFVSGVTVTFGAASLTPTLVNSSEITVSVPSAELVNAGSIPIIVANPSPGGGPSNTMTLVIHEKAPVNWRTVVNNKMTVPGSSQLFNSYNQPSINANGLVVFKGQSKSGSGSSGPRIGVYTRDVSHGGMQPITKIADRDTAVPQPNNIYYNGVLATFTEFPSFPRIDLNSDTVAVRGQSQPVWTYTLPDGTETRIGTSGLYASPGGSLVTGASLLGAAPGFSYFEVPNEAPGTRFDQFPGSPAVVGATVIFKGNYTVGTTGKTGVYFRDMVGYSGELPVQLIANTDTLIPNQPLGGTVMFGSTAPPSAANATVLFAGFDNEDNPTLGGIYAAPLGPTPALQTLVGIGTQVPGESSSDTFNRFGEGLAFDGRFAAFWGAWGTETKTRLLPCPTDGNTDLIAACNQMYPNGYQAQVPVHQGIFVYDTLTGDLQAVAKTTTEFDDFVYWVFSGYPPGAGSGSTEADSSEPPRWRSSAFAAVTGRGGLVYQAVFKARTGSVDGIFLAQGPTPAPIQTVFDTTMSGQSIDPEAPAGSTITSVGIERESLRADWLVVTSSMEDVVTGESGAGVYVTNVTLQP